MSNDSYSGDLDRIGYLASSVKSLMQQEEDLREEIANLTYVLSNLSPAYDEDGYDMNESARYSIRAEIESYESMLVDVRNERQRVADEANQIAEAYRQKSEDMKSKRGHHEKASNTFKSLTGKRFGASTAAAGAAAAAQRVKYYESQYRVLLELSQAARAASHGEMVSVSVNIAEKGQFRAPEKTQNLLNPASGKNVEEKKKVLPTRTGNHSVNQSLFHSLGVKRPLSEDKFNPGIVSIVSLAIAKSGSGFTATHADALLASQWGTSSDSITQYRKDNNYQWVAMDNGNVELVPDNVTQEYRIPTLTEGVSPKDALTAYMYAHNYGKDDYDTYSHDPEWQKLHRRAFPQHHNENHVAVKTRRNQVRLALRERGIACGEMDGYVTSRPFENGRCFVAGGDRHLQFLDFEKNWYRDYKKDDAFHSHQKMVDSSLIEGVEVSVDDLINPGKFWGQHDSTRTKDSYMEIAKGIPLVQQRLKMGESLQSILADPSLGTCASMYFRDPIEVYAFRDFYVFGADGRHRVLAAQELGYDIPVRVSTRYIPR